MKTGQQPDAHTLYLLRPVPGIGTRLSLVLLYAIHRLERFPSVQDFASYCRLVKCRTESGGKRVGTAGKNIDKDHRKWALSEAATRFWRHKPQGQKLLSRLEKTQNQGKTLRILAHTLGRAVYFRLKRQGAFALALRLQT